MKTSQPRAAAGFTLVELLVVVLIIATLSALSLIGFRRMRAAGDRASTITVMRQMQVANASYSIDHNGRYVPIVSKGEGGAISMEWYRDPTFLSYLTGDPALLDDLEKEVTVPTGVLDPVVLRAKKRQWERLSASFGFNSTGLTWPTDSTSAPMSHLSSKIENPGKTAFIATATNYMVSHAGRNLWKDAPVEGKTTTDKMAFRHGDKAVIVYYDGSTGFITQDDIRRFDANGGINNPFWKATK